VNLRLPAKYIDHASPAIRLNVVIDNGNARIRGTKHMQSAQKSKRKSPRGPCQRRILQKYPLLAPTARFLGKLGQRQ
jgi:hypothetical protein